MEVAECTNIVHGRIQKFEPENVTKIIGYLLLNHSHHEIVEYAYGPDELIHSLINEARAYIASSPIQPVPNQSLQYIPSPAMSRQFSFPSSFRVPAPYWEPHLVSDNLPAVHNFDFPPPSHTDLVRGLNHQDEFLNLEDQLLPLNSLGPDLSSNYYHPEAAAVGGLSSRIGVRSPSGGLEYPSRVCQYFYKGFCKHGMNCRYIHAQTIADNFISPMYSPHLNELVNDDHVLMAGSLEKLEIEITELLRARRGIPVSIASLPTLYQEMYGRTLQAEGYLTESQRHGKAGFNLTRLLARLKSSIRLIDRPHGQHSVILAEDAPKYMEYRNDKNDSGAILGSSHQIYLTFPAESTFTEEDVSNYFEQYGPVHDVRIPRQEKRMFGFVSFFYPETVKLILGKGHPHYICGARVLVKPYKEKSRITDKKFTEKLEIPRHYPSQYFEVDPDPNSFPGVYENSRLLEKQLIQDCEQVLELQGRRLFGLHLTPKPLIAQPYYDYGLDEVKLPDDSFISVPVLKNCSTSDEKSRHTCNSSSNQDSGHIELPDSPFASPRLGGSISTGV